MYKTHKDKDNSYDYVNYIIDNKLYSSMPVNVDCKDLSLSYDLQVCQIKLRNISESLIKYQISISKFISARYLSEIFPHQEKNIFGMLKI